MSIWQLFFDPRGVHTAGRKHWKFVSARKQTWETSGVEQNGSKYESH